MEQSGNLKDKSKHQIAIEELKEFEELRKGHEKLMDAIGAL